MLDCWADTVAYLLLLPKELHDLPFSMRFRASDRRSEALAVTWADRSRPA